MLEPQLWRSRPLLPLSYAENIVEGALPMACGQDMETVMIAVLDTGGHPIVLKREDGSGNLRLQIAVG